MTFFERLTGMSRELKLFVISSLSLGVAFAMFDTIFNNFLNSHYTLTGFQRSFLEFPREFPGVLVIFISMLFWFLCSRRLAALALALGAVGVILVGFVSSTYAVLVICLFVYSLGQHIFLPLASTIGMELAQDGKTGQRLGQLNAVRNLATIVGSFVVYLGFKFLGFTFQHVFALSAAALAVAAIFMFLMKPQENIRPKTYLTLHREYSLYYILAVLFGSRKQLFITFAPWVIVSVFKQPTQTLATLMTIGGIIGIFFQPILGKAIDKLGERVVLASEAVLLVVVCLLYGFSGSLFQEKTAFLIICGCYLADQILMSVGMARSTYMKKIAMQPGDIQPALTTSVTIDHLFSIVVALIGGVIWNTFGYQYVFLMGVFIAAANFFVAIKIRIPKEKTHLAISADRPTA